MKKVFCVILTFVMIVPLLSAMVYADDNNVNVNSADITVEIDQSYMTNLGLNCIVAKYTRSDLSKDPFVKKSWLIVDLADENTDLKEVYKKNSDKENIIEGTFAPTGNVLTQLLYPIYLNGTYIFCGWSDSAGSEPDYIKSINITNINVQRPMIFMDYELSNDFSQDTVGSIIINKIECETGADVKRYILAKSFNYPPGHFPDSLPPNQRDQVYDEMMADRYTDFLSTNLCIQNVENPITPDKVKYPIKDFGEYILIVEDTNGRYNYKSINIQGVGASPKITVETLKSDSDSTIVKVNAESDYGIARFDYAVLGEHNFAPSVNGTDEYFLEKEKHKIDGDTIEINGTVILCAVDNMGNTSYKRVEADGDNPEPTPTDYLYEIKNLSISTQSGEALSAPPQNAGFMAEVEVNKTKESDSKDYIFVAVYDKNGTILNIDYATAKFTPNYDYSFGFNIPAQNSEIGSVKAFVWDGFNSAKPLAETKTINFN